VNVVYGRDHIAAMLDRLAHKAQSLAQLEKALAEAGIVYAVVEDDEIRTFTGQFADALRYPHLLLPRSNPTDESAP